jgi:hypothetical protein
MKNPELEEDSAFIVFKPGRYYSAMWCMKLAPGMYGSEFHGGDLLAVLWREDSEPTKWHFDYRFRYYRDDKPWKSSDKKSGYKASFEGDEEHAIKGISKLFGVFGVLGGKETEPYWIKGNSQHAIDLFAEKPPPWLHQQQMVHE